MDNLFFIISFILLISVVVFIVGLIMIISYKTEETKKIATKMIIYSVIAFIIGFGSCFGLIFFGN